mmetsp:Transcript_22197/g.72763  ORF Transcript_22197/g.72763 Transcript_22197/m.72763 type:complete len:102 (-) Transcript_22197:46-351(-)
MSVPSDLRNSDLLSSLLPAGAEADAWHPSSGRVRARGRARGLGGAGPGSWSIDSCASAVSAVSSTLSEEAEDELHAAIGAVTPGRRGCGAAALGIEANQLR